MTYGCHNKPRPVAGGSYIARDGRVDIGLEHGVPIHSYLRFKRIPIVMSTDCQYTLTTLDAACNGCQWQHGPEIERDQPGDRMPAARGMAPPRPERTPERADIPAEFLASLRARPT